MLLPIKMLLKHCGKAAKAIDSGIKARERLSAQKRNAEGQSGQEAKRAKTEPKPIFQPTDGSVDVKVLGSLQALTEHMAASGESALRDPLIIRFDGLASFVSTSVELKAAVCAFEETWKRSPLRCNPGRALQRLKGPAEAAANKLPATMPAFEACLAPIAEATPELSACMAPALFGVAAKTDAAYFEKEGLPAIRLAVAGHREVVMTRGLSALKIIGAGINPQAKDAAMKLAVNMLNLSKERALDLCRKATVWRARLGPGDALYIPAGMLSCELVAGIVDGKANAKDATALARVGSPLDVAGQWVIGSKQQTWVTREIPQSESHARPASFGIMTLQTIAAQIAKMMS